MQASEAAATRVFRACVSALWQHGVILEAMLLKPQMIIQGSDSGHSASPQEIATATLRVLRRCSTR